MVESAVLSLSWVKEIAIHFISPKNQGLVNKGGLSDVNRIPVLLEWFHIIREKSFYGSNFMLLRILLEILKYPLKRMTIK